VDVFGGLGRAVGNGLTSMLSTAFDAIGATLRTMLDAAQTALPGGLLAVVAFVVLLGLAWNLAKR
jgi:hypothetical protein